MGQIIYPGFPRASRAAGASPGGFVPPAAGGLSDTGSLDTAVAVEMAAGILENPLGYQPGQVEAAAETMLRYRKGAEPARFDALRRIAAMWLTNRGAE